MHKVPVLHQLVIAPGYLPHQLLTVLVVMPLQLVCLPLFLLPCQLLTALVVVPLPLVYLPLFFLPHQLLTALLVLLPLLAFLLQLLLFLSAHQLFLLLRFLVTHMRVTEHKIVQCSCSSGQNGVPAMFISMFVW